MLAVVSFTCSIMIGFLFALQMLIMRRDLSNESNGRASMLYNSDKTNGLFKQIGAIGTKMEMLKDTKRFYVYDVCKAGALFVLVLANAVMLAIIRSHETFLCGMSDPESRDCMDKVKRQIGRCDFGISLALSMGSLLFLVSVWSGYRGKIVYEKLAKSNGSIV